APDSPDASERTASRPASAPAPGRQNAPAKTPGPVALSRQLESPGTPGRAEHGAGAASRAGGATSGDATSGTSPAAQPSELPQDRLHPRPHTGGNVFVRAGTVWTGTGRTLNDAGILIRNGKIVAIGRGLKPPPDVTVIDARNRFVMPGIIDTHSHIMITGGVNEATQSIVCECRIADVVNSQDVSEFRALAGGVTTARLLHGSANTIGGQDAVVKLKHGRTAAEHLMSDQSNGVKFALGENVKYRRSRFPNTRLGVAALLQRAFAEAERYREQRDAARRDPRRLFRRDLRLDVLADILEHRKWIHSHCYRADEILMLLRTAESLGIRVQSLQHVLEGYKVAPEIAAHGASCSTFADWWAYKVEAYDAIPHNAALLHEAAVNAVIKSDDAELIRHLYQEAAKTVRYGCMPLEAALRTITVNPARELRLLHRIGTLEVGKDGDLAIFNGYPLDAFARCEKTVIEGEVYFNRFEHPTAMTAAMKKRTSGLRTWRPAEPNRDRIEQLSERLAAQAAGRSFALVGATVHPVEQPDIADGVVIVRDGRIEAVGRRGEIPVPGGIRVVDVRGLHVFPGIIDAGTTLGLTEIGKVVETHDYDESGPFQPDLVAATGVNRDSELIPVARAGGITTFLTRPTTGLISGRASVMQTHGWTSEEMTIRRVEGLWMRWPRGSGAKSRIEQLEEFFAEARRYDAARTREERGDGETGAAGGSRGAGSGDRPSADKRRGGHVVRDPRFEAMRPFVRGEARVFVEADGRNQIAQAVLFAERHGLRIVVCGGTDAWKLADALRVRKIPVIVGPVMRRPVEDYDPSDAPYANPGRLHEAGVAFCIRSDSASNSRNAPFEAAMAVAFGLPEPAAVRAVTLSPAEILGIADTTGSIVPGKRADLVVTDGSILQPTSHVLLTVVDGVPYAPESRQTRFYRRYRRRILQWKAASGQ
ncbi:MAG: amidohydrolase, partial [Planctomycetota bacterium]